MTASLLSHYAGWPVIIGSGLGGLSVASHLNQPCLLISPSAPPEGQSTALAQGGMAAAIGPHDSPDLHAADTLRAGVGLCDETVVQAITQAGPDAVDALLRWGVPLARLPGSHTLALHLEAAHRYPRVVYSGGDQTGAHIAKTLAQNVKQTPRIHTLFGHSLISLHVDDGVLRGVWTSAGYIPTSCCILATGSCGGLYRHTTIPLSNKGVGLALAARAGARLADMEFTQFHPTALKPPTDTHGRLSLISEAVRGAGAVLVLENHQRFTDELAPRDVVSRAIASQIKAGHQVFLDGRILSGKAFSTRFPGITAACRAMGRNPDTDLIPVRPAMHYHMGGIAVDQHGRSSIPGLWACGEVACTGLHGANRLASNSLLEALVCGKWIADDINGRLLPSASCILPTLKPRMLSLEWPFQEAMEEKVGILRNEKGLTALLDQTLPLAHNNACALTASFIAWAALQRRESRGGHWRDDAPVTSPIPQRQSLSLVDLPLP